MQKILNVRRLNLLKQLVDLLMLPIMYLISGTFREKPQRTHAWNIQDLSSQESQLLSEEKILKCKGLPKQLTRHYVFLFHVPILDGWKNFVVIEPLNYTGFWHVGWKQKDAQISILPIIGPVRMLIGPGYANFFGVTSDGIQIPIHKIGEGRTGDNGSFSKVLLC
ncbi:MAG TPA: hypothetical protein VFD51_00245 [Patescibacteria group bacterium]|nr:hypothetical protein [Patescibacteria group bacterium]